MSTVYVVLALATIVANACIGGLAIARHPFVLTNMVAVGVPVQWMAVLGILKAAGAVGLLLGLLGVPYVGTAAATGLCLFFVGAIATHLRANNHSLAFPSIFLALGLSVLVLDVVS